MYKHHIKNGKLELDNMYQKKDTYQAANKIAKFCQTSIRGRKARENVQLKRWERANIAAYRIQV